MIRSVTVAKLHYLVKPPLIGGALDWVHWHDPCNSRVHRKMQSAARRTMEEAMSGCDSTPLIGRISGKEREEKKEAQEQKKNKSDRSRFRIPIISIIYISCLLSSIRRQK